MAQSSLERFSDRVENYVKYRPDYPREIIGLLREETGFRPDSAVADIGSGTGIFARLFLENGNRVFGVEPNEAMRRAAEDFLGDFPLFESIGGTAENTGLPDESVDFVTAAQAFHWFDLEKVRPEFKRILRKNGYIALVWNKRQLDSNSFLREYERFLLEYGTDYQKVRHEQITKDVLEQGFGIPFREAVFPNSQTFDLEGLRGRMLSSSYMPTPDNPRFDEMIKNLKMLFAEHQKNGKIQILYDTNIFYTQY
ncbi:MAG: class I SAM-dependent methyltransferase [Pyrinomonadaceae bacterium]